MRSVTKSKPHLLQSEKSGRPLNYAPLFYWVRVSLRLTQVPMAAKLGIAQGTLSKIEKEQLDPTADCLLRLFALADTLPKSRLHASRFIDRCKRMVAELAKGDT